MTYICMVLAGDAAMLALRSSHDQQIINGGEIVKPTPAKESLPLDVVETLEKWTELDKVIYDRANELLDEKIEECKKVSAPKPSQRLLIISLNVTNDEY